MSRKNLNRLQEKEFDNKKLLLSIMLLVSAIGIAWFAIWEEPEINDEDERISVLNNEAAVNKHLRKTSQKIESQKLNAQIENYTKMPDLNGGTSAYEASSQSLDFKEDPRIKELTATLGKEKKIPEIPKNPKDIVQAQLYDQQKWNEYNLSYRQAYAQRFIEKAKKDGWEIRLNAEFKIIKAKKIKKDDRPQLFRDPAASSSATQSPH
ncbi:MAG: hypothetical protein AABY64_01450 [Bdellovibrionota bacterium]